ncbi:hypothetical protein ABID22_004006 [Pontibacter aydingkolensis]|uniref:Por secretion system C-terminal sorting domain-containing protein n=1 Tax=Pontibacter aydingkolensis TaxID=1911536 RepID=A0ABS7CZG3_9BACT|nr:hypothetical protein [Pontibacter aydingkolensis]MBW7469251.1 hypothetical protein [Pontibacter aydingkolensis]
MKKKYALALGALLPVLALNLTTQAQNSKIAAPSQEHILVAAENGESSNPKTETLSGINLTPAQKGTFQLDFSQELDENATLAIKNTAGKVVFQKPISIADNKTSWQYNVGKLKPDTYLVEVKTSDTTYWTKFKISK